MLLNHKSAKYSKGGSLKNLITKNKESKTYFDCDTIFNWAKDIINGLDYLHEREIIHRDLKPEYFV